jgi:hypothetical protein
MDYVLSQLAKFDKKLLNTILEIPISHTKEPPKSFSYSDYFPLVVDHIFIKHCTDASELKTVRKIVEDVKVCIKFKSYLTNFFQQSSYDLLNENKWLESTSLIIAQNKLKLMEMIIGTFNIVSDQREFEAYYENLDLLPTDNRRVMSRKYNLFTQQKILNTVLNSEELTLINNRAASINAYHSTKLNLVCKYFSRKEIFISSNF